MVPSRPTGSRSRTSSPAASPLRGGASRPRRPSPSVPSPRGSQTGGVGLTSPRAVVRGSAGGGPHLRHLLQRARSRGPPRSVLQRARARAVPPRAPAGALLVRRPPGRRRGGARADRLGAAAHGHRSRGRRPGLHRPVQRPRGPGRLPRTLFTRRLPHRKAPGPAAPRRLGRRGERGGIPPPPARGSGPRARPGCSSARRASSARARIAIAVLSSEEPTGDLHLSPIPTKRR